MKHDMLQHIVLEEFRGTQDIAMRITDEARYAAAHRAGRIPRYSKDRNRNTNDR